jgi:predicted dienelactone hydrolase
MLGVASLTFAASSVVASAQTASKQTDQAAQAPVGYHLEAGPWKTGVVERLVLKDATRSKDLIVTVRYPIARTASKQATKDNPSSAVEKFPMVIFSHGLGGAGRSTFVDLANHWASHGYVVVLPTHSDSIALRREEGKEVIDPRKPAAKAQALATVDLRDRVADVKFILDSIPTIETSIPEWRKASASKKQPASESDDAKAAKPELLHHIDTDRLAIAGHSAGAYTAQLAIGVKVRGYRVTGKRGLGLSEVGDPRLKAALIISGQGTTSAAFTKDSWKDLTRPILVLSGSKDTTQLTAETPESRCHPYDYAKSRKDGGPGAYLLFLEGATHGSYQGKGLTDFLNEKTETPIKTITDATASATLAFLDAWIKGDADAKKALESDTTKRIDPTKIRWEWK